MNRVLLGFVLVSFIGCSTFDPLAGGSSQQGNGVVVGKVVDKYGSAAPNIVVKLYPMDYNPLRSAAIPDSCIDTTDSSGNYMLKAPHSSLVYQIYASNILKTVNALAPNITISGDTTRVANVVVSVPGTVKVAIPDNADSSNGYIYIPGTDIFVALNGNTEFAVLTSVPEGVLSSIQYSVAGSIVSSVIRYDVSVIADDIVTVFNPAWKYARSIILNTSVSGAAVAGNVYDFPVLIRLNSSNFDCTQAKNGGADIRFTKQDNAFLPYEIERWDAGNKVAEIWVKADTVHGSDSMQSLMMYWGNVNAAAQSNPAAVFDTANGFQGVWHLAEAGNAVAKDASGNHYDGTPSDTAPAGAEGAVGWCRAFNGVSNYIRMNGTAAGKLNFQENDIYTISAWAYADTLDNGYHLVVGKSNEQYYLKFKTSVPASSSMVWEFVEYHNRAGWYITNTLPILPSAKAWTCIVGVRKGTAQYFYLNGELVDSTISVSGGNAPRYTGDDVTIGKYLSVPADTMEGKCPFPGKIDEVRISNVTYGADWIKLCYMNQKEQDALVKW